MTAAPKTDRSGAPESDSPGLEFTGDVQKRFGGVHAILGADLVMFAIEVLALVGENGRQDMLVELLAGIYEPDAGSPNLWGLSIS